MNRVNTFLDQTFRHVQSQVKALRPFSWQTALLLSLFSWLVYLLLSEPISRKFVALFGWFFLILGTDWALLGKEVNLLGLKIRYGAWLTGALICAMLLSYRFIIWTLPGALIVWPLVSAAVAAIPKFIKAGPDFKTPSPADRQDIVLQVLLSALLSCWLQLHFSIQDILESYPSLAADNVNQSAFLFRLNPAAVPLTRGVIMLDTAEALVRKSLSGRSWIDVQRWLNNPIAFDPQFYTQIFTQVYGSPNAAETQLWQLGTELSLGNPDSIFRMQAKWIGPSSQENGYTLEKPCLVREAPAIPTDALGNPQVNSYVMECQPITSTADQVNIGRRAR